MNGFRPVDDIKGIYRWRTISGCTTLLTGNSKEKGRGQYDKMTFVDIWRVGFLYRNS